MYAQPKTLFGVVSGGSSANVRRLGVLDVKPVETVIDTGCVVPWFLKNWLTLVRLIMTGKPGYYVYMDMWKNIQQLLFRLVRMMSRLRRRRL